MGKDPWKCQTCRRLNKSSAGFCGSCGYPWDQCWDRSYVHTTGRSYTEDVGQPGNWQKWDTDWSSSAWEQRPKSPRRRSSKSPRSSRKGEGKGKSNKSTMQNNKWPTPVLDYTKIKDGKKPEVVPPRTSSSKPPESSPEVQELLVALQTSYPDGLPQEVQLRVDRLKRSTTMDLKKHIGQLTKVKKDLDSMRDARARHKEAWKRHVTSLVENTKAQLQQFQSVLANFETCEAELVQNFDLARRAILEITHQTTPAEEDVKAIKELDSDLLAGGAEVPIVIEDTENGVQLEMDVDDIQRLQTSLSECIESLSGKKARERGEDQEGQPAAKAAKKDL